MTSGLENAVPRGRQLKGMGEIGYERTLWLGGVPVSSPSGKHLLHFYMLNRPLSPNSDQHQFSPDNIRTLSRDMVMRINKMITKEKMP